MNFKNKIMNEELKLYYKKIAKWKSEHLGVGGQQCGLTNFKTRLICEEIEFEICINHFRSQLKNKEMMWILFELYLDEIIK